MLITNGRCNKLGNKIKNFCSSKYTIKEIKRQLKKQGSIFALQYLPKDLDPEHIFFKTFLES
jgi:hypothetical protein